MEDDVKLVDENNPLVREDNGNSDDNTLPNSRTLRRNFRDQRQREGQRERCDWDQFDDRYEKCEYYDRDWGRFARGDYYDRHRQYDAYEDDCDSKFNPKVEILKFEGKHNVDDFLDWLNYRIFEYYDVPENKKVSGHQA